MNTRQVICLTVAAICIVALAPALLAQPDRQAESPLPTPTLPPWCEDVGSQQPCLPWRPTPMPTGVASPTPIPNVPPAVTAPRWRFYLPMVVAN